MSYKKKTWVTGEKIIASDLNNMETGIEKNSQDIEALNTSALSKSELNEAINTLTDEIDKKINSEDAATKDELNTKADKTELSNYQTTAQASTDKQDVEAKIELKQDKLTAGTGIEITEDNTINCTVVPGSSEGGTSDYDQLSNKPKINGVELTGDLSTEQLKIEIPDITQLTEDVQDVVTDLGTKANASELESLQTEVSELQTTVQSNSTEITNLTGDLANEAAEREEADTQINQTLNKKMNDAVIGDKIADSWLSQITEGYYLAYNLDHVSDLQKSTIKLYDNEYYIQTPFAVRNLGSTSTSSGSIEFKKPSKAYSFDYSGCLFKLASTEQQFSMPEPPDFRKKVTEVYCPLFEFYAERGSGWDDYTIHCKTYSNKDTIVKDETWTTEDGIAEKDLVFHFEYSTSSTKYQITLKYYVEVAGTKVINNTGLTLTYNPVGLDYFNPYMRGYIMPSYYQGQDEDERLCSFDIDINSVKVTVDGASTSFIDTSKSTKDYYLPQCSNLVLHAGSDEFSYFDVVIPSASVDDVGGTAIKTAGIVAVDNKTIKINDNDEIYAEIDTSSFAVKTEVTEEINQAKTDLQSEISSKVDSSALDNYVQTDNLNSTLEGYVQTESLTSTLSSYATTDSLQTCAKTDSANEFTQTQTFKGNVKIGIKDSPSDLFVQSTNQISRATEGGGLFYTVESEINGTKIKVIAEAQYPEVPDENTIYFIEESAE